LSDALDRGITVTEIAPMDRPVDAAPHTAAAFVGRALRGPLNTPVLVDSFATFKRRFGGIWHRSSLGPAVRQFFEHGGSRLYIVRVANNARGAMICLPADHGMLVLRALEPGSTEHIRAAVDYDGIEPVDTERFNLTLQRIAPETGLVLDQEIYRRVSCRPEDRRFVIDALLDSSIARAQTPAPPGRPVPTSGSDAGSAAGYVSQAQRGNDGDELCDYDLVGSAERSTGIFALEGVERFDLLYLPAPGKDVDLGPTAILAAELYCRRRGAMLILDPPSDWTSASQAVGGIRESGYASCNMISYFPRMIDREDRNAHPRGVGGALAGLLCKLDEQQGSWLDADQPGFRFSRRLRPTVALEPDEAIQLVREGLNVIAGDEAGRAAFCGAVTLGRGSPMDRRFASLPVRRFCLQMTNAIARATRWAVFEAGGPVVARNVEGQVQAYLAALADRGAFATDRYTVECESGIRNPASGREQGVTILLSFQPVDCDDVITLTLHQAASGFRVSSTAFAPVTAECA